MHVDIDPAEIGKIRTAEVPIVGDARVVLTQLLEAVARVRDDEADEARPELDDWWTTLRRWQDEHPLRAPQEPDGPLRPQTVVRAIGEHLNGQGIVVTGVGQHQMWAAQHIRYERPRSWINSGGLGTMGFCVPAAIGAKAGPPPTPRSSASTATAASR